MSQTIHFLIVVGIALLAAVGVFALERPLPAKRRERHNEVTGFIYAVVGVAYAVLLGLVVVTTWESWAAARANTFAEADALTDLYWYGRSLPAPEHATMRRLLSSYIITVTHTEWPELAHHKTNQKAWDEYSKVRNFVESQRPATMTASLRYQVAINSTNELGHARLEQIAEADEGIPGLLWTALIGGGIVTIGFAYFFGMKSTAAQAVVMFSLTLLIGGMLLVAFELNTPFSGPIRIGPDALELVYDTPI